MSHSQTQKIQAKAAADGKQRIAISASTTQSLENSVGVMLLSHLMLLSIYMHCHKQCYVHANPPKGTDGFPVTSREHAGFKFSHSQLDNSVV